MQLVEMFTRNRKNTPQQRKSNPQHYRLNHQTIGQTHGGKDSFSTTQSGTTSTSRPAGQAAITMPLMAPLSDLVGVSRQVAVLAFQLGDGLTNIIIPTSASLIGCLGVARIDWITWVRFAWKLVSILFIAAGTTMIVAVSIGLS